MYPAIVIGSVFTAVVLAIVGRVVVRNRRRRVLLARPLSAEQIAVIERRVPIYRRLPDDLKSELQGLVNVFLAEKHFEGAGGLKLTDEMRLTIAAQACMLLLNRRTRYFGKLKTVIVYPHTYVAMSTSYDGGIETTDDSERLGESWQNGPVVLAWDSVIGGVRNITDAHNVVLHEFAHQLDQEDGAGDGAPILQNRSSYATWAKVLSAEYEALQQSRQHRRRSVLNKYGATNPAEFFAVATETFFEKPRQMHKRHPELYEELKHYYNVDPLAWEERA